MVELDVRDDRDLGRKPEHRAVRLVALDDEPALPRARVAAELRHRRADQPGRVASASRAARTRSSPRSFPCRACRATTIDAPQRARARRGTRRAAARAPPGRPTRRPPPSRAGTTGSGEISTSIAVERVEVRRLDAIPAADLGAPGPRELRVGREPGAADPDEPEPPPSSSSARQARSAPRRSPRRRPARATRSIASPIRSRRGGSSSSERTWSGTSSRSRSRTMIAPPARTKYSAFFAWWSAVANGYGTRIAGLPAAAISQTELPARASDEVGGRVRGADPVGRRDQPVVAPLDAGSSATSSRARRRCAGSPGRPRRTPRSTSLVERARARERAGDEQHRAVGRKLEDLARLAPAGSPARAPGSAGRRRGSAARRAPRADRRGRRAWRTAAPAGSRARGARRPRRARPGSASSRRRSTIGPAT